MKPLTLACLLALSLAPALARADTKFGPTGLPK